MSMSFILTGAMAQIRGMMKIYMHTISTNFRRGGESRPHKEKMMTDRESAKLVFVVTMMSLAGIVAEFGG